MQLVQSLGLPIAAVVLGLVVLGTLALVAKNYKKCPPNKVLVVYGRKGKNDKGYRLITGGSAFVWPLLESYQFISLENFSVESSVDETPNIDGVPVNVNATANVKVSSNPVLLGNAVERMLGKTPEQIKQMLKITLDGLLRQIVGKLTIEKMVSDREALAQQVLTHAETELNKLGFNIDNFVVSHVGDHQGYIKAMGAGRTAEVKRDAIIAEAEAQRDSTMRSAAANQAGKTAQADADRQIAEADRNLALKKAEYMSETETANAKAQMAGELQRAEIDLDLRQRKVKAEEAETTARIKLAEQEAQRVEKELVYTKIRPAEAEAKALTITSEGRAAASVKDAEATKTTAEAQRFKVTQEGDGQAAAQAALKRSLGLADAEVIAARGTSEASAVQSRGEAEAAAKQALLLAEAMGLLKKNEALDQMSESAKLIIFLERLPEIIDRLGEAGQKIVGAAFEPVGTAISRIDSINITDLGHGSGDGEGAVGRFVQGIPKLVFNTMAQAKALGLGVDEIFAKLGVQPSALLAKFAQSGTNPVDGGSGTEA